MSVKKIQLDELFRRKLSDAIEEVKNYEQDKRFFLPADILESLVICKLYAPSEYLAFQERCRNFGIFYEDLNEQIDKYLKLFNNEKKITVYSSRQSYQKNYGNSNINIRSCIHKRLRRV